MFLFETGRTQGSNCLCVKEVVLVSRTFRIERRPEFDVAVRFVCCPAPWEADAFYGKTVDFEVIGLKWTPTNSVDPKCHGPWWPMLASFHVFSSGCHTNVWMIIKYQSFKRQWLLWLWRLRWHLQWSLVHCHWLAPFHILRFRILEAQMETGTPYMLYKASFPNCLFVAFKKRDGGNMRWYVFLCSEGFYLSLNWLNSRIMPIANPTSRTWAPSIAPTYVVRSLSTLLQMKSRCAI